MRLLYGTGNEAKIKAMQRRLVGLPVEIISVKELGETLPAVEEDGNTPLENAAKKALVYYRTFGLPVFSCDSGLYFDHLPDVLQPGVHVRRVHGRYLSDDEMISYYSGLAASYGDLRARYRNAICLILDQGHRYQAMEESMASEPFLLTSKPHPVRNPGFPLDSISVDIKTGRYYYDLPEDSLDQVAVEEGFLDFFKKHLCMEGEGTMHGTGAGLPESDSVRMRR